MLDYVIKDINFMDFGRALGRDGGLSWECTGLIDVLKAAV